jgi:hypothetical protein
MKYLSLLELIKLIQKRPWNFLWDRKNIKDLIIFISWYSFGIWNENKILKNEEFYKLQDYIIENTIWIENRTNECWIYWDCLLKVTGWNDEKAFDLFFTLMDEFIEKEKIEINID